MGERATPFTGTLKLDFAPIHQWIERELFEGQAWIYNGSAAEITPSIYLYACRARDCRPGRGMQSYIFVQKFQNLRFSKCIDDSSATSEEWTPVDFPQVLDIPVTSRPGADTGPQDPRVFQMNAKAYIVYNILQQNGTRRMALFTVEDGSAVTLSLKNKQGRLRGVEKNWTPLVRGVERGTEEQQLHLIYTFRPFVVFECDIKSGECGVIFRENTPESANWIRGGTPALKIGAGTFFGLLHSTIPFSNASRKLFPPSELPVPARFSTPNVYRCHAFYIKLNSDGSYAKITIDDHGIELFGKQIEQPYGLMWNSSSRNCKVIVNINDSRTVLMQFPKKCLLKEME